MLARSLPRTQRCFKANVRRRDSLFLWLFSLLLNVAADVIVASSSENKTDARGDSVRTLGQSLKLRDERLGSWAMMESMDVNDAFFSVCARERGSEKVI